MSTFKRSSILPAYGRPSRPVTVKDRSLAALAPNPSLLVQCLEIKVPTIITGSASAPLTSVVALNPSPSDSPLAPLLKVLAPMGLKEDNWLCFPS